MASRRQTGLLRWNGPPAHAGTRETVGNKKVLPRLCLTLVELSAVLELRPPSLLGVPLDSRLADQRLAPSGMDWPRLDKLEGPAGDDEAAGSAQSRRSDLQRRPLRSLLVGRVLRNCLPRSVAGPELEAEVNGARPGPAARSGRSRVRLERRSAKVWPEVGSADQRQSFSGHSDVRRLARELRRPPQLSGGLRPGGGRLVRSFAPRQGPVLRHLRSSAVQRIDPSEASSSPRKVRRSSCF